MKKMLFCFVLTGCTVNDNKKTKSTTDTNIRTDNTVTPSYSTDDNNVLVI